MAIFKVGDRVRLLRNTRHNMVRKGEVGTVREIRPDDADVLPGGVSVEFMKKTHPHVARQFGIDPEELRPFGCLFPAEAVARMLAKEPA